MVEIGIWVAVFDGLEVVVVRCTCPDTHTQYTVIEYGIGKQDHEDDPMMVVVHPAYIHDIFMLCKAGLALGLKLMHFWLGDRCIWWIYIFCATPTIIQLFGNYYHLEDEAGIKKKKYNNV